MRQNRTFICIFQKKVVPLPAEMKNYIPYYFNTKANLILLVLATAVFGELFILFFQPMESRTWVESDWEFLLWCTIVVLVAVAGIAISRTIMYQYAKKHKISYLDYAIWIIAEVTIISVVYASFPIVVLRSFATERELTLFYLFKEAFLATTFSLLIPYAVVMLWISLKNRDEQILKLTARLKLAQEPAEEEPQPEMFNFYDERGELKLSVKPEMVYYIESADNYVQIYYMNLDKVEKLMLRNSLKNIEWRFHDRGLVRCHRSYIVNMKNVRMFRRKDGEVILDFGDERIPCIPVSKGYGETIVGKLIEEK